MPKFYTPKPAIQFANSGTALQTVGVQKVEPVVQIVSDKATVDIDFSGVPRFPRRLPVDVSPYTAASALRQLLQFGLGPVVSTGSAVTFTHYSWRPRTRFLQAEQHGIYDLTSRAEASATNPPISLDIGSNAGSVIREVHPTSAFSASEVVQWNAYYSGSEMVDSQVSIPRYYSKTSVDGSSTLTQYNIWKYVPTILDVLNNVPYSSPSGSSLVAPALSGGGTAAAYKGYLGTPSSWGSGSSGFSVIVPVWSTISGRTPISATDFNSASLIYSCSGNLIYTSGILYDSGPLSGVFTSWTGAVASSSFARHHHPQAGRGLAA